MSDFEAGWEQSRERLVRMLVGIVKDIDLAEDLAQETYVRAREKFLTYRGGDFGAWLAVIARHLAFAHWRRAYTKAEVPSSPCDDGIVESDVGTYAHLDTILVREAVSSLSPILRNAILLKHYGGLNYIEIAERLGCPVGTAKRRVHTAVQQLRQSLGVSREATAMGRCSEIRLIDYAYGAMCGRDRETVESHLAGCEACRSQLSEIEGVMRELDAVRDHLVCVDINDIHADGSSTTYSPSRIRNRSSDQICQSFSFGSMAYHKVQSIFVDGEEAVFEITETDGDGCNIYDVQLGKPLAPGESRSGLTVYYTEPGIGAAFDIGFGRWVAVPDNSGTSGADVLLVQMVRLPEGARVIGSIPDADEVRSGEKPTLIWRRFVRAGEIRERPVVVYSLP